MKKLFLSLLLVSSAFGQAVTPGASTISIPSAGINSANVNITGGSISNTTITGGSLSGATGGGNTFTGDSDIGPFLSGAITLLAGTPGNGGFFVYTSSPMQALAIDVTQSWNTVSLTGATTGHPNEALTFSVTPGNAVQQFVCLVTNTDSVVHNPTIPSSFSFNRGATTTTFTIQPSTSVLLVWDYDGSTYWLRGDPVFTNNLTQKTTPVTADEVAIGDSASNFTTKYALLSALPNTHSVTFVVNGNGTVLTTGVQSSYVKVPYGGTLIGWTIIASPSGSVTVDIDRAANSAGLPSVSIVGSGTKPNVSSAVENASTSFTSWTSTTITALDNLTCNITAATTSTYVCVVLYYE